MSILLWVSAKKFFLEFVKRRASEELPFSARNFSINFLGLKTPIRFLFGVKWDLINPIGYLLLCIAEKVSQNTAVNVPPWIEYVRIEFLVIVRWYLQKDHISEFLLGKVYKSKELAKQNYNSKYCHTRSVFGRRKRGSNYVL